MERELGIGKEVLTAAKARTKHRDRAIGAVSVAGRLGALVPAYSGVESYVHDGNERAALTSLLLFAFIETSRTIMVSMHGKWREDVIAEQIDQICSANEASHALSRHQNMK
jgi:nitrate/nitrite transporter NarK